MLSGKCNDAIFALMKQANLKHRVPLLLNTAFLLLAAQPAKAEYVDHRGHNIDSCETVLASHPSFDVEIDTRNRLMYAYLGSDDKKSLHHARELVRLTDHIDDHTDRMALCAGAFRIIGQVFYANELYDSAAYYFNQAIAKAEQMQPKDGSIEPDNTLSAVYGALGNLMNIQDSVRQAENYYRRALSIFECHHWNESIALVWYNMGEMYVNMEDSTFLSQGYEGRAAAYALEMYRKGIEAGVLAGDSFFIAGCIRGVANSMYHLGNCEEALPVNTEALDYLSRHKADNYQAYQDALTLQANLLIRTGDINGADKVQKLVVGENEQHYREQMQKLLCEKDDTVVTQEHRTHLLPFLLSLVALLSVAFLGWQTARRRKARRVVESSDSGEINEPLTPSVFSATPQMSTDTEAETVTNALPVNGAEEWEAGEEQPVPGKDVFESEDECVIRSGALSLTERELAILRLLSQGKTTPQIAETIFRSQDTIRWYRKRLLQKFNVHNTAALIKAATELGLI